MNPQNFLQGFMNAMPVVQEYGNALLSPFMPQGLDAQPLGGSGLYGTNPDGTPRSMGEALDYVGGQTRKRNAVLQELMEGMR